MPANSANDDYDAKLREAIKDKIVTRPFMVFNVFDEELYNTFLEVHEQKPRAFDITMAYRIIEKLMKGNASVQMRILELSIFSKDSMPYKIFKLDPVLIDGKPTGIYRIMIDAVYYPNLDDDSDEVREWLDIYASWLNNFELGYDIPFEKLFGDKEIQKGSDELISAHVEFPLEAPDRFNHPDTLKKQCKLPSSISRCKAKIAFSEKGYSRYIPLIDTEIEYGYDNFKPFAPESLAFFPQELIEIMAILDCKHSPGSNGTYLKPVLELVSYNRSQLSNYERIQDLQMKYPGVFPIDISDDDEIIFSPLMDNAKLMISKYMELNEYFEEDMQDPNSDAAKLKHIFSNVFLKPILVNDVVVTRTYFPIPFLAKNIMDSLRVMNKELYPRSIYEPTYEDSFKLMQFLEVADYKEWESSFVRWLLNEKIEITVKMDDIFDLYRKIDKSIGHFDTDDASVKGEVSFKAHKMHFPYGLDYIDSKDRVIIVKVEYNQNFHQSIDAAVHHIIAQNSHWSTIGKPATMHNENPFGLENGSTFGALFLVDMISERKDQKDNATTRNYMGTKGKLYITVCGTDRPIDRCVICNSFHHKTRECTVICNKCHHTGHKSNKCRGTMPDWELCDNEQELISIMESWNLKNKVN